MISSTWAFDHDYLWCDLHPFTCQLLLTQVSLRPQHNVHEHSIAVYISVRWSMWKNLTPTQIIDTEGCIWKSKSFHDRLGNAWFVQIPGKEPTKRASGEDEQRRRQTNERTNDRTNERRTRDRRTEGPGAQRRRERKRNARAKTTRTANAKRQRKRWWHVHKPKWYVTFALLGTVPFTPNGSHRAFACWFGIKCYKMRHPTRNSKP